MNDNELIRLRAYEIWAREGQPEGRELEHWLQARQQILGTPAERRDENRPPASKSQQTEEQSNDAPPSETPPDQPKGDELKESTELG
ncbi:hypothetical protein IZ6_20430 [Terrihabitans soli]|uniref:DUF2934 domain-containing protein n=1 Tax=Terrihabitans soli TaxID=708113 RepID=A0A6S6QXL5_9HYPH|nr:DUF2934 domain-containing protein [Terrihabitans soli]BCJ91308.1 hypothetical protein IZ6_20430 [Terrihabitans soli]